MSIRYKDYDLDASSAKSYEKDEWMTSIHISQLSSDGYKAQPFYCKEAFGTKEEADEHAINLGKEIIDGTHPTLKLTV
ncbi:MAG: hypothetical protein D8M57_06245 [Candidatus Scalindua sp. AMX11]|nr:MAG: hypothetical protein DWQ00_14150 [Candidatus Scalindua sp.]NOG85435.1 hypothetical protein [Planctomycetota bacterium]RZV84026.1 MAG: hypothetical protein EX341_08835 [Candidatus Scalindua sp. SCAELEC01]TDE65689.1 MAG: hypothetical protein D8M57_06245 [Candidatus Scalindua sp. AMX11]